MALAVSAGMLLAGAGAASAQTAEGYALVAAGGWTSGFNSGALVGGAAGGEARLTPVFGVGGEGGALVGPDGNALFTLSAIGRARFARDRSAGKLVPFVAGGYTRLIFFEGSRNGFNVGGGIDYMRVNRSAIRVELQDVVRRGALRHEHYWTVRVGVTLPE
jgi:hypothetical protein